MPPPSPPPPPPKKLCVAANKSARYKKLYFRPHYKDLLTEGQITPRKSRTPFVEIPLFYVKIPGNPFV